MSKYLSEEKIMLAIFVIALSSIVGYFAYIKRCGSNANCILSRSYVIGELQKLPPATSSATVCLQFVRTIDNEWTTGR